MSFPRVKPIGWALFETLTSPQMTLLDINVSKATDSTYVKDYAGALWFPTKIPAATWNRFAAGIYLPTTNQWVGLSTSGCVYTVGGGAVQVSGTFPAGLAIMTPDAVAFDGVNTVVCGGSIAGSGNAKYRRASLTGTSPLDAWTTTNSPVSNTSGVNAIGYFASGGVFVAGFDNGAIETSSDGVTWTSRGSSHGIAHNAFACNGTIAILISAGAGATSVNYATSYDGISWTNRTLPISAGDTSNYSGIAWSLVEGCFLVIGRNGLVILKSTDGINWTQVTHTFSTALPVAGATLSVITVRCLSSLWVANYQGTTQGLMCSIDAGQTWKALLISKVGSVSSLSLAVAAGQMMYADDVNGYLSNQLSL